MTQNPPARNLRQNRLPVNLSLASVVIFSVVAGICIADDSGGIKSDGAATLESVAERYSGDLFDRDNLPSTEAPDFQRHVVPLLGRLGCNGRACHGSFQGQGGFQLSLFGFDFESDHAALLEARVDTGDAEASKMLTKAVDPDGHGGGMRFDEGSWQYNLLYRWIEGGAIADPDEKRLARLDVSPAEIVAHGAEKFELSVVAVWEDGTREDVTELCRFQSNNESVADVNERGEVATELPGDTHVVVFYDNAVEPVQVLHPYTEPGSTTNQLTNRHTNVDRLVIQKLDKLGIIQSDLCDDETFLRRVSLDIAGTLPTPDQIRQFVFDQDPLKRSKTIDALLETPAYNALWTTFFCDLTGNNSRELNNVSIDRRRSARLWYDWIYKRVSENTPYNEMVEGIVLASTREPDETYTQYCESMCASHRDAANTEHGATPFASRDSMPYYWMRQSYKDGTTRAISFAHSFMGIRIQCAQCHKHPFDQWTQDDFTQFSRFFTGVSTSNLNSNKYKKDKEVLSMVEASGVDMKLRGNQLNNQLKEAFRNGFTVPHKELLVHAPKLDRKDRKKKQNRKQRFYTDAILLGSDAVDLTSFDDVRIPVMKWLNRKDNPYFANAIVNRVWAHYFGVGIVDPQDDLNLANPPSNGPLLAYLADGFVENGYDLKWLHREITLSRTYQLSWEPNATNRSDRTNFSRALPRRLQAEVALDALKQAVVATEANSEYVQTLQGRATAISGTEFRRDRNGLNPGFVLRIFGRSTRTTSCDCDRSDETSLSQTVWMQNDRDVHSLLTQPGSWADEIHEIHFSSTITENERKDLIRMRAQMSRLEERQLNFAATDKKKQSEKLRGQIFKLSEKIKVLDERRRRQIDPDAPVLDRDAIIEEAFLRTLSRFPTPAETDRCQSFFKENEEFVDNVAGLMWALVNTKEFIVNH